MMEVMIAIGFQLATGDEEKKQVARLVANVAINEPNRRLIVKARAIQLILEYLENKNIALKRQALRAIRNLSSLGIHSSDHPHF
jgi:hypothetical protein